MSILFSNHIFLKRQVVSRKLFEKLLLSMSMNAPEKAAEAVFALPMKALEKVEAVFSLTIIKGERKIYYMVE